MNVLESSQFLSKSWQRACHFQLFCTADHVQDLSCTPCKHKTVASLAGTSFSKIPPNSPTPKPQRGGYLQQAAGLTDAKEAGRGRAGRGGAGWGRPGSCPPPRRWMRARGKAAAAVRCCGAPTFAAEPIYPITLSTWRYGKYAIYKDHSGKIKIMPAQYLFLRQNTTEAGWKMCPEVRDFFLLLAIK